jgi:hypothetical protein
VALGARVVAARRGSAGAVIARGEVLGSVSGGGTGRSHRHRIPATPQTRHLFNAELWPGPPGAHLINVARGSVVDQQACRMRWMAGGWALPRWM